MIFLTLEVNKMYKKCNLVLNQVNNSAKNMRLIIRKFSTQKLPTSQFLMSTSERKYPPFESVVKDENSLNRDVLEVHRAFFPLFVKNAFTDVHGKELSEVFRRFEWVQYYNEPRELYPSLIMMHGYKILEQPDRFTSDSLKSVSMLSWAFEMIIISILLLDDIIDGQIIRWKIPCWYKNREIGLSGINDANLMRSAAFNVLKKYFSNQKCYQNILNHFHRIQLVIGYSQIKDVMSRNTFLKSRSMNTYTIEEYEIVAKYKAYECVVKIPFLLIMNLLELDENEYRTVEDVLTQLGRHYMVSNDVYDCFGKYKHFGRLSTDIPAGTLTWVIVTALQHANKRQRILLEKNYGKTEEETQNIVKEIFKEIDVIQKYFEYKKDLLDKINKNVEKIINPGFSDLVKVLINLTVNVDDKLTY